MLENQSQLLNSRRLMKSTKIRAVSTEEQKKRTEESSNAENQKLSELGGFDLLDICSPPQSETGSTYEGFDIPR
ncbi:hypothetical protein N7456_001886 [Penicillium angulare]|uniref:Uncharacterized protein n=1 Tax=Penicillium angulare TaxID=116970 RepID=A0A9W9G7A4_9EURO|nr:hypothetical protein N7456_001886 [Penicillium angulare]